MGVTSGMGPVMSAGSAAISGSGVVDSGGSGATTGDRRDRLSHLGRHRELGRHGRSSLSGNGRLAAPPLGRAGDDEAVGRVDVADHEDVLALRGVVQDEGVEPLGHAVQGLGVGHVDDGRARGERRDREDPVGVADEELVGGVPPAGPADPRAGREDQQRDGEDAGRRPTGRRRSGPDSRAR